MSFPSKLSQGWNWPWMRCWARGLSEPCSGDIMGWLLKTQVLDLDPGNITTIEKRNRPLWPRYLD